MINDSTSLTIPLILTRAGTRGTIQPIDLSLASSEKPGEWIPALAAPWKPTTNHHAGSFSLSRFLPKLTRLSDTNVRFPPNRRGSAIDHYPIGIPQLPILLVGLYALAGNQQTQGSNFSKALAGWAVAGTLNPDASLGPTESLSDQLKTIARDRQHWFSRTHAKDSIRHLLLAEADRGTINDMVYGTPNADPNIPIAQAKEQHGCIGLFEDDRVETPWLIIHFASTIDEALIEIFGSQRIHEFQASLRAEQRRRRIARVLALVLILIALVSGMTYISNLLSPAETIALASDETLTGISSKGRTVWSRNFNRTIEEFGSYPIANGRKQFYAILVADKENQESLIAITDQGKTAYRVEAGTDPKPPVNQAGSLAFRTVVGADIHPHPGTELISSAPGESGYTQIGITGNDGRRLKTFWHYGRIDAIVPVPNTTRFILRGRTRLIPPDSNVDKRFPRDNEEADELYHYVVLCLNATDGPKVTETPVATSLGIPATPPDWYYVIAPRGRIAHFSRIPEGNQPDENAIFMVHTFGGYRFRITPEGEHLTTEIDDIHVPEASYLLRAEFTKNQTVNLWLKKELLATCPIGETHRNHSTTDR